MTKEVASEGEAIVERIKLLVALTAFVSLVGGWLSTRYWPLSLVVIALVLVPSAIRLSQLLRRVQTAMDDFGQGFSEVSYANVRWGYNPAESGVVKGPYCPNPAHGSPLRHDQQVWDAADSDLISDSSPLCCPQDVLERFVLSDPGSATPVSVGSVRKQVAERLERLGVWKAN